MSKIKFKIEGIQEAKKLLSELSKSSTDKIIYDINRAASNIVKKELQESAPDSNSDKANDDKIASNVIVKRSESRTGTLIGFAKKVFYVRFLEMGTVVRQTLGRGKYRKGANRGQIERRPFIENAHNRAFPKVVKFFVDNYLKIVNRSLRKQVRKFKK